MRAVKNLSQVGLGHLFLFSFIFVPSLFSNLTRTLWDPALALSRCTFTGQSEFVHNPLSGYLGWTGVAFRSSRRSCVIDLGAQCLFFLFFFSLSAAVTCHPDCLDAFLILFFLVPFLFFPFLFRFSPASGRIWIDMYHRLSIPNRAIWIFFIYLKRFIWLIAYGLCICRA